MVQLKRNAFCYIERANRFQFHNGTIKTQDEDGNQRDNMISIP